MFWQRSQLDASILSISPVIGGGTSGEAKVPWLPMSRAWGRNGTHHCDFSDSLKKFTLQPSIQTNPGARSG